MSKFDKCLRYTILPFRFSEINTDTILVVNEVGEFIFLPQDDFDRFIHYDIDINDSVYHDLKSKQIISDGDIEPVADMLSVKYRTKKRFLYEFTSLHMIVVTLRCNSACSYCQVSKKDMHDIGYDMSLTTAKAVTDLIFESPSNFIKIEFQGGEPLLNFDIIMFIVKYALKKNKIYKKQLDFVVCTNMTLMNRSVLKFIKKYGVMISTSLDGPEFLHDRNRILQNGRGSYAGTREKLSLAKQIVGNDGVDALMTTTKYSLNNVRSIIDEYVGLGLKGIFLRSLNPYGFAKTKSSELSYDVVDFIDFYKRGLDYIIELNLRGIFFVEYYASLLLSRILTPFSTGFVDLQSPTGAGIQGVIYNYDGEVYPSDEGRMLASMGDKSFLMGHVKKNTRKEIFNSIILRNLISNSCLEGLPICSRCAYLPFCGTDPIRNYSEQGSIDSLPCNSDTCTKNKAIFQYLFKIIHDNNQDVMDIFWSWVTMRTVSDISLSKN